MQDRQMTHSFQLINEEIDKINESFVLSGFRSKSEFIRFCLFSALDGLYGVKRNNYYSIGTLDNGTNETIIKSDAGFSLRNGGANEISAVPIYDKDGLFAFALNRNSADLIISLLSNYKGLKVNEADK